MSDDFEAMARAAFVGEAEQMLAQLEAAILRLSPGNTPEELTVLADDAFRAVHTIKGSAGIFGMAALVRLTHQVESYLDGLRCAHWLPTEQAKTLLLTAHDLIRKLCAGETAQTQELAKSLGEQIETMCVSASDSSAAQPGMALVWHLSWRPHAGSAPSPHQEAIWQQTSELGRFNWWPTEAHSNEWQPGFEALLESPQDQAWLQTTLQPWAALGDWSLLPLNAPSSHYQTLLDKRCTGPEQTQALLRLWSQMGLNVRERLLAASVSTDTDTMRPAAAPQRTSLPTLNPSHQEGPKVRVGAAKLDELIERIAEVSTSVGLVHEQALRSGSASLLDAAQQVQASMSQAREDALNLRMVPITEVFARFPRLVHDLGQRLGREVELLTSDGDAEIDRAIVEAVADPLVHLIRNSMDHGIEPAEERLRRGKPAKGHIALSAYRDAGHVVIEVRDDGRGLDRERIRARAVERGLVAFEAKLSNDEVLRLICLPGFSTASEVTDISGRGVGMDVVKRNVDELHGELLISSEPGQGSCFQIRVPMTLALLNAFWVQVDGAPYLLPLDAVLECINTPPECLQHSEATVGTFSLRDEVMPYVDLRLLFTTHAPNVSDARPHEKTPGRSQVFSSPSGGLARSDRSGGAHKRQRRSLIVVRARGLRLGLLVDRLMGEQQVVIKSLGAVFSGLRLFSGAAILANGTVATVLDVGVLQDLLHRQTQANETLLTATS